MKNRYNKLIVVRQAESRIASAAFAAASADVGAQHALATRLRSAVDSLLLNSGPTSAAEMAARMELASRMATAQGVAQGRIETAQAAQRDAATARKSARRALDAARDIRREAAKEVIRQREAKIAPRKGADPFK